MVHSLTPASAPAVPILTTPRNTHIPSFGLQRVWACHQGSYQAFEQKIVHRRTVTLSLAGALLGLNFSDRSAGAARRPPPPPPHRRRKRTLMWVELRRKF
ncbi:unnamed protein product [Ilex paraguariensis]|uniref:Uncharacterized protein n=1 Tax=Ilex paraguariensis TaxID=185542 RepID=A0ABC8UDN3_9AQUA